ncbi:antibiotic biosynthesis monooxygenase [Heyndrickxia oleronia]|uniref:Antibiotic biosynthesis monooxygenase n=1 Tax=Heyndrickxia oleronia TaxID=38875 RepID=A0AAW6SUB8_9BACI|nr:antibiotic biosynthesis monooxygenase [Heyndrickxia oleronia]MDH5159606.1 antibiotic biosynthesis monooxygenase [Heyndrickxia oleronia]
MKMMKAVNTIRLQKGKADEILIRFEKPKAVHTFEGFVFMEVLKKENSLDYDELKICTTWEDQSFFEKWLNSRESTKSHRQSKEKSSVESPIISSRLTTFEVVYQHQPGSL